MSLTFKTDGLAFIDVPAPYFGQDVVIRVNKQTVKTYVHSGKLGNVIRERKDISDSDITAYYIAADFVSRCSDPKTGEPSFKDGQIDDIVNMMPKDVFENISSAFYQLDPHVKQEDLDTKKKKS